MFRNVECKHIKAVQFWLALKEKLKKSETFSLKSLEVTRCKFCGSPDMIKYGRNGRKQVYKCKNCNHKFVPDDGFRKLKNDPRIISLTLDLYFKGVSLRKIADHLKQFYNLNITHVTVYQWIKKYIGIMSECVSSLEPQLSGNWMSDEMAVNVKGEWYWLWHIMDEEIRFLLASMISKTREIQDARRLFSKAKRRTKSKPKRVVTDGLPAYKKAFKKEFWSRYEAERPEHVSHIRLSGDLNTNLIERFHGTRRERDKVLRAMKKENIPTIEGFNIYYNFIRPYMALNGQTPAEKAGINLQLEQNKWLSLIKKSLQHHNLNTINLTS